MMGTIFSFVDKLISSLGTALIGFMVAAIGFKNAFPTVETPPSPALFWLGMIFFIGMPIFGWVASLIAMHWYDLTGDKMKHIQQVIHDKKLDAQDAAEAKRIAMDI
jgi:Na+/melibiose symporter-like transporter